MATTYYPQSIDNTGGWQRGLSALTHVQNVSAANTGYIYTGIENCAIVIGFGGGGELDQNAQHSAFYNIQTQVFGAGTPSSATVDMSILQDGTTVLQNSSFTVTGTPTSYVTTFTADRLDNVTTQFQYSNLSSIDSGIISFAQLSVVERVEDQFRYFDQVVREKYGYDNRVTVEEALADYMGLGGYSHGQYQVHELFNMMHFNRKDLNVDQHDPIAYYMNKNASLDVTVFEAYDPKQYTRDEYAVKNLLKDRQFAAGDFAFTTLEYGLPLIERYEFNEAYNGLESNTGNTLYTNGTLSSMYKENATALHVGYSAGVFATGTTPDMVPSLVGGTLIQMDIKPYAASSSYVGQNTLFEIPDVFRIDFSGSGYNRFVAALHDGSSYVSAVPSDAITFGAGEDIQLEYYYVVPEILTKFIINGVHNTTVEDGDFNGVENLPSEYYVGTDQNAANPWSGSIRELRLTDDLKFAE